MSTCDALSSGSPGRPGLCPPLHRGLMGCAGGLLGSRLLCPSAALGAGPSAVPQPVCHLPPPQPQHFARAIETIFDMTAIPLAQPEPDQRRLHLRVTLADIVQDFHQVLPTIIPSFHAGTMLSDAKSHAAPPQRHLILENNVMCILCLWLNLHFVSTEDSAMSVTR